MSEPLSSHYLTTPRQTTHFLETGPADGPLMVFLHGWPGIGLLWRAQLEALAADGWRCVAPDLRGYGDSSVPDDVHAYAIEEVVSDVLELLDHLGARSAVLVGHDWGSVVGSAVAAHHPDRVAGVVLVSLAYQPDGHGLPTIVPLVDRTIYPAEEYPDGQWDYYRYYTTHFDSAVADLDADVRASLASIFRSGDPRAVGSLSPNAVVTQNGGRFGVAHRAPAVDPDPALWPANDFEEVVYSFERHGFRAASAWYMNDDANLAYAGRALNSGRLEMPVLFVDGDWDVICSIVGNRQGDPMRAACAHLTLVGIPAGHWLPLERKHELVEAIQAWSADQDVRRG